jgi:Domain of unknown function (DUF6285)
MAAPHDPPSAAELVAAVRAFLDGDGNGGLGSGGWARYQTRIAINILRMVERELALGPSQAAAHQAALARLGMADEADLARAIRLGQLDDRLDDVTAVVRATVAAKLEVANPAYLDG